MLTKLCNFKVRSGPVVLCIMDGIASGPKYKGNAVANALTPTLAWLKENSPNLLLKAHGAAVGMPSDSDMGNSEVGHNAIGCGRVFAQGAKLVSKAIQSKSLFQQPVWNNVHQNCRENNSTLHFIGLLSDGNVHSHINHLQEMIREASNQHIARIRIHVLLDGRDVGETSALEYINPFEEFLAKFNENGNDYRIASGGGRMKITMDRYNADWGMVKLGWETHVLGKGRQFDNAADAILTYRNEFTVIDQDLPPFVIAENGNPIGTINDNDSVILFNFRGDRAIEMCNAFETENFDKFDREKVPKVFFAAMMEYDADLNVPKNFLVNPPELDKTVGEFIANAGIKQYAISETQKFGHVTYFFNGNRTGKFNDKLEDYDEITSDKVPFEERPWMKAAEITDKVIQAIESNQYGFIRLNYPNADMVGHTGNYLAAVISVEAVDLQVARLLESVKKNNGILIIIADHGNADEMYEWDKKTGDLKLENGKPKSKTCHTLNPVPCYIFDPNFNNDYTLTSKTELGISSIAATCLNFLGYNAPDFYDASLVAFKR